MKTILQQYLNEINVPNTPEGCRAVYESNPYKNSMFGMAEMLREYGVRTSAQKFDPKTDEFDAIPVPSITVKDREFVVVTSVGDGMVTYECPMGEKTVSVNAFSENWDGVVLQGIPDVSSGEPDYKTHRCKEIASKAKFVLFLCAAVVLACAIVFSSSFTLNLWGILALLFNIGGIYVAYLLILKQMHVSNPIAEKLCGIIKTSRCDSPKLTEHSTVLGRVTLSEIGMGFFVVNTLVLLLFPTLIPSMAVLSAVGLLFSFWSVWYQKTQAKTWCTLCLIVLTLMWLQAATYFCGGVYREGNLISLNLIVMFAFYGAMIFAVSYLLDEFSKAIKLNDVTDNLYRLKLRPDVMKLLLDKQPVLDGDTTLFSSLVFGPEDGSPVITVFSNPYCSHCAELHKKLNMFRASHPDVRFRYTMTFFTPEKSIINRYLIAAYLKFGEVRTWELMTRWYADGKKLGEKFFDGMNLNTNSPEVEAEFNKQLQWQKRSGLTATPIIMVNGHRLPQFYSVEDLGFFVDA